MIRVVQGRSEQWKMPRRARVLVRVPLESSWHQYGNLVDGGPDFGLLRSLEAKNILRLLQVLPAHFTVFTIISTDFSRKCKTSLNMLCHTFLD